jgi:hypothetical protein
LNLALDVCLAVFKLVGVLELPVREVCGDVVSDIANDAFLSEVLVFLRELSLLSLELVQSVGEDLSESVFEVLLYRKVALSPRCLDLTDLVDSFLYVKLIDSFLEVFSLLISEPLFSHALFEVLDKPAFLLFGDKLDIDFSDGSLCLEQLTEFLKGGLGERLLRAFLESQSF